MYNIKMNVMNRCLRNFHSRNSVCYEKFKPSDIYTSTWRKPLIDMKDQYADTTWMTMKKWEQWQLFDKEWVKSFLLRKTKDKGIASQAKSQFLEQKVGRDLSAAYFVIRNGGSIKFAGNDRLYKAKSTIAQTSELPKEFSNSYLVEEVYLDNVKVYYEGLNNFKDLPTLKVLSLSNNEELSDWHIDYICSEIPSLMFLDISNCRRVTYRGITCLYRLRNLKVINVSAISNAAEFKYACLELEDELPGLKVIGINIDDDVTETVGSLNTQ